METPCNSPPENVLLLLKERIIKVEPLLEKYGLLQKKFDDLQKSHYEAAENEKKAKKDAARYLEKYCRLTKKYNSLLNESRTLEDAVKEKANALKDYQNEITKLESLIQMYKLERQAQQKLRKDRDYLLLLVWKVLKLSGEETTKEIKKRTVDIFFKRFEKEIDELKLEDFRNSKRIHNSKASSEEPVQFPSDLQIENNIESDFIDAGVAPDSAKILKTDEFWENRINIFDAPKTIIKDDHDGLPGNIFNSGENLHIEERSPNCWLEVNKKACKKKYYKTRYTVNPSLLQDQIQQPLVFTNFNIDCPDNCSEYAEVDTDILFGNFKDVLEHGDMYPKIGAVQGDSTDVYEFRQEKIPGPENFLFKEDIDLGCCQTNSIFDVLKSPECGTKFNGFDEDLCLEFGSESDCKSIGKKEHVQSKVKEDIVQNDADLKEEFIEPMSEIPDEEIFNIFKNFSCVRLVSPLKDEPRTILKTAKRKQLFDAEPVTKCVKIEETLHNESIRNVEEKSVQTWNVSYVDKTTQTSNSEREWKSPSTDAIITKIWRKLRTLDHFRGSCKTQESFFSLMKMLIKIMGFHSVSMKKKLGNMLTKKKITKKAVHKTFWKVEELEDKTHYSDSMIAKQTRVPIFSHFWNGMNSFISSQEKPLDWFVTKQNHEFGMPNHFNSIYPENYSMKSNFGMQHYYSGLVVKKANENLPTCALVDTKFQMNESSTNVSDLEMKCSDQQSNHYEDVNETDSHITLETVVPRRSIRILERNKSKENTESEGGTNQRKSNETKIHIRDKLETLFGELDEEPSRETAQEAQITQKIPYKESYIPPKENARRCSASIRSTYHKQSQNLVNAIDFDIPAQVQKDEKENTDDTVENVNDTNLLDSILTAMTKQAEEYKCISPLKSKDWCLTSSYPCISTENWISSQRPDQKENFNRQHLCRRLRFPDRNDEKISLREDTARKLAEKEVHEFLKLNINTVEQAEEKMKNCITTLEKVTEDVIARIIVAEVMANVDEELQEFDRPAPPLTQTQHRLITILTVLTAKYERYNNISKKILWLIRSKLFPETFFWPDDSLEMAARFYSALCKQLNDFKTMWKFCFKAICSMKQRWSIPILVVIQVWPDILHNASEVQDNILVNTFVSLILHSPKMEGERRKRQQGKLLAIKHLLMNFYNFEMNFTIEEYTQKLFRSFLENATGSARALVLVAKCRSWQWTKKNVIGKLMDVITDWSNEKIEDSTGVRTLSIIQQIMRVFPKPGSEPSQTVADFVRVLMQLLSSNRLTQASEEKVVKILCSLKNHTPAKDVLVLLLPRFCANSPIYREMERAINSKMVKQKDIKCTDKPGMGAKKKERSVFRKKKKKNKKKKRPSPQVE